MVIRCNPIVYLPEGQTKDIENILSFYKKPKATTAKAAPIADIQF